MSLLLSAWLQGRADVPASLDAPLRAVTSDSREVNAGDVFIALPGATTHGLAHLDAVRAAGAAAVLVDAADSAASAAAASGDALAVRDLRRDLGALADLAAGSPSSALRVVGVTGTNGKTSIVQLLADALERLGLAAGTIGTLGAGRVGRVQAGERTTPDVLSLHALLGALRDDGARAVAMEVSSHALAQGRVDGVRFEVAVFTNLTRDHLDYHRTMDAYGDAKARLFGWPTLSACVVNIDDAFGRTLAETLRGKALWSVSARGASDARISAENVQLGSEGVAFVLAEGAQRANVASRLLGRFNVDNLLAVAAAMRALGFAFDDVAKVLGQLPPVHGRMTALGGGAQPLVVVDYAHTPDALEQALASLRGHARGALACVFGCGGERDRGKRPQMAAVAERLADRVLVTDDNPRSEDGDAIVADIVAGFREPSLHRVVRDRGAAIRLAVAQARTGDVVLVAGKGHEPWQEIAGVKLPFDDVAQARAALEQAA